MKWTKELLQEEALKYETRNQFQKQSTNAYESARNKKLLNEICQHMSNGYIKWTKENVIELASKYENFTLFTLNEANAYYAASQRIKCLDEIKALYSKKHIHANLYWNEEKITEEALKYETRIEFKIKNQSAYIAANKIGILDKVCSHMQWLGGIKWNEEKITEEALKYNTCKEFRKNSLGAYRKAIKLNILKDIYKIINNNQSI